MEPIDYSLQELADLVGVERRTIRSWIEQGLLKGPETVGRNARYGRHHLDRLKAIMVMRDFYGYTLSKTRQELLLADEEQIRKIAQRQEVSLLDHGTAKPNPTSALDYIRSVQSTASSRASNSQTERPVSSQTGVGKVLARLQAERPSKPPPRKARGEVWFRIAVTPDVELAVRGELDPDRAARIEQIADYLRELLLGGSDE